MSICFSLTIRSVTKENSVEDVAKLVGRRDALSLRRTQFWSHCVRMDVSFLKFANCLSEIGRLVC